MLRYMLPPVSESGRCAEIAQSVALKVFMNVPGDIARRRAKPIPGRLSMPARGMAGSHSRAAPCVKVLREQEQGKISLQSFELIRVLGRGIMGKVLVFSG